MVEGMVLAEQAGMEPQEEEAEEEEEGEGKGDVSCPIYALEMVPTPPGHFCLDRKIHYLSRIQQNKPKPPNR